MLVLHTGWSTMLYRMELKPNAEKLHSSCAVLNGDDPKLLDWIERSQISALISDNFAIEDARIEAIIRITKVHDCQFIINVFSNWDCP